MSYTHPILPRTKDESFRAGIFDITSQENHDPILLGGSTRGKIEVYHDLDEFYRRLHKSKQMRIALGIPELNYLAYSFECHEEQIQHAIHLAQQCHRMGYEVRSWVNEESGNLLIVAVCDDLSEDSGWDLYEWALEEIHFESYGHAHWWEFCYFGIPLPPDWRLECRNHRLFAVNPENDNIFAMIG